MYSIIAYNNSCEVFILENQTLEYCTSVALDLYCKSNLSYRIVSIDDFSTVVDFIRIV